MKIKTLLVALLVLSNFYSKAQYVTIPDTNFVAYLQANYPTCMNGNQMDTTCADIINETILDVYAQGISDLTGIKYFRNHTFLSCGNNQLTNLQDIPSSVLTIDCFGNDLVSLPNLPENLQNLYCNGNQLTSLPSLPASLQKLVCYHNQLTSLPILPANLQELDCGYNQLTNLPTLPSNIQYIYCSNNYLFSLPNLPNNLLYLDCLNNQLSSLPSLPLNIHTLECSLNQLISLPTLPSSIQYLACRVNQLTNLPSLPPNILTLQFQSNNIVCFPEFPASLNSNFAFISIAGNPFTCLPNYVSSMSADLLAYPLCVNGDTINNNFDCASTVSINTEASTFNNQLNVYPNPATGIFNFKTKQLEDLKINSFEVFDLLGQKVFDATNVTISSSSNFQIDLSNYPNGIYFIKANGLNKSFTKKIIKN